MGYKVASYIDAWIEIPLINDLLFVRAVASYIDAWIEILIQGHVVDLRESVASYIDAWIEIDPF